MSDCGCHDNKNGIGNPVVIWPGWVTNQARNNGADVNPLQIVPLHYGNFAAYQTQLFNGLQLSDFGLKNSYQGYLSKLYSSASMNTKGQRQTLPSVHPSALSPPSQVELAQMVTAAAPNESNTGGTGQLAPGVDLTNRRFYG